MSKQAVNHIVESVKARKANLEQCKELRTEFLDDTKRWILEINKALGGRRSGGYYIIKFLYPRVICAWLMLAMTREDKTHEMHQKYQIGWSWTGRGTKFRIHSKDDLAIVTEIEISQSFMEGVKI